MIISDAEDCLHPEQLDRLTFWRLSASSQGAYFRRPCRGFNRTSADRLQILIPSRQQHCQMMLEWCST